MNAAIAARDLPVKMGRVFFVVLILEEAVPQEVQAPANLFLLAHGLPFLLFHSTPSFSTTPQLR